MGVDINMTWEGQTEKEMLAPLRGKYGYLRGAYFGGLSDVLQVLFYWMDWDKEEPFNPEAFERALNKVKGMKKRPGSGQWKDLKYAERGWDGVHKRQEEPIPKEYFKEYEDFLALGKRLIKEGKNPAVYISY
jgi:hypothetical protein